MKHSPIKRQTNIELLRIISIIMIIFHHFAVHGGFNWEATAITIPHFWYNFIVIGGKVGVNIFILISGYFLITKQDKLFDVKKILKLWGQIIFYSIGLFVIFSLFPVHDYANNMTLKSLFPITFSSWWFASTYFVLYLIHPFLNRLLNGLDKKAYQSLLILLVTMWSVIPTLTASNFQSNYLWWFVTLYVIAGYARLYGFNHNLTSKQYFFWSGIFSAFTYLSNITFTVLGTKWEKLAAYATHFYGMEKLSILLIALSLFLGFMKLDVPYNKFINLLASTTFGIYLLHDHRILRPFLWHDIFQNQHYQDSLLLIPYSILVVGLVYSACALIDLIRQKFVEKAFIRWVDRHEDKLLKLLSKLGQFCRRLVFG
ncbi:MULTISPECIES: acyltransferase [unclassified Aerococcus]|uniref:acyltransferase family protein n=1 Tax=unclassified Aerococcus TaxID=2618060 RepID=UPI0008A27DC0|nr:MULTISPECIES: acyltransferase [unclassified Aerococcus]MDK6368360.1 acyltransferase [Aerococcus sp. UMB9870]MDK6687207.1 acyltransferase [Aerococcus sp. UMB8623]MDK6941094.1 acyltransferase [Aerococcus sp. UMB8487]OFK20968.1 hypothetical protein HMPREF2829_06580 [Aerococcus sp. HMSC072A12]OFR34782.1 hypothetical protein HMPREF2892_04585 [Aerococcus sp. HMSC061A03]